MHKNQIYVPQAQEHQTEKDLREVVVATVVIMLSVNLQALLVICLAEKEK